MDSATPNEEETRKKLERGKVIHGKVNVGLGPLGMTVYAFPFRTGGFAI
jgi:hypothetical protein